MSLQEFNPNFNGRDEAPSILAKPGNTTTRCFIKEGDVFKRIDLNQILFFFVQNKTTYAQLIDKKLPLDSSLRHLTELLGPHFIRIHKGFLINQEHINQINLKESCLYCHLYELPIGGQYKKELLEILPMLK